MKKKRRPIVLMLLMGLIKFTTIVTVTVMITLAILQNMIMGMVYNILSVAISQIPQDTYLPIAGWF
jgi:hypothetical protein